MALYKADHVLEREFTKKLAKFVELSRSPDDLEPLRDDFKLNQHKFDVVHRHLDLGPDLYRVQEEINGTSRVSVWFLRLRVTIEVKKIIVNTGKKV